MTEKHLEIAIIALIIVISSIVMTFLIGDNSITGYVTYNRCVQSSDCIGNDICYNRICQQDCTSYGCNECQGYGCEGCMDSTDCEFTEVCKNYECIEDCSERACSSCNGYGCIKEDTCDGVECREEQTCKYDSDCSTGEICSSHKCETDCSSYGCSVCNGYGCVEDRNCVSNWQCDSWSSCSSRSQVRECKDTNNCKIPTNTPLTTQQCGSSGHSHHSSNTQTTTDEPSTKSTTTKGWENLPSTTYGDEKTNVETRIEELDLTQETINGEKPVLKIDESKTPWGSILATTVIAMIVCIIIVVFLFRDKIIGKDN